MGEAAFGFLFFEGGGGVVAPATLGGKSIPDQEIDVGGFSSALLNPVEHLFVGTAGERTQAQGFVTDPEEMAEAAVEAFTKELVVIRVEFAARMDANLVEGAGEKIKAAEFGEGGKRTEWHGRLGGAKRGDEHSGIRRFHERFADEHGVGTRGADAGGIGGGVDAAFADGSDVGREKRNETLAQAKVRLERGEVAIVDADDLGTVGECAGELGRGVNLEERVEARGGCGVG